jgi:hypothetical protein
MAPEPPLVPPPMAAPAAGPNASVRGKASIDWITPYDVMADDWLISVLPDDMPEPAAGLAVSEAADAPEELEGPDIPADPDAP